MLNKIKEKTAVKGGLFHFKSELDKIRFWTMIGFVLVVAALAWQSDDAYHGYVMSRRLAEGQGFVYNVAERATASTCPLFSLIIALAYFITREMYFTSLAVCTIFSSLAYYIFAYKLCNTTKQVLIGFMAFVGSQAFISYTTSGLENSLLFLLSALFIWRMSRSENYNAKEMLLLALIFSLSAMTRMDSVLLFIPLIVWIYLFKRDGVSFIQAVGLGILGLMPFILWECFATFYFGFPFPNPAYVKLGTHIAQHEYYQRGIIYAIYTAMEDLVVLTAPLIYVIIAVLSKKIKYILAAAGIIVYGMYVIRIGGDFMMGRHFTNLFFISVCMAVLMFRQEDGVLRDIVKYQKWFGGVVIFSVLFAATFGRTVGMQYISGHIFGSQISDEREYYFGTTGLYNNVKSLIETGRLCVSDTWNTQATDDIRNQGVSGNIIENAAGILVYYNPDIYLNDTYSLGDPFLSKLPAKYNPNWRVGHIRREVPDGYRESIWSDKNKIKDVDLHEYYDKIRLITRGNLFNSERIKAIIDINLGKYQYLIDNYEKRQAENEEEKK